MTREKFERLVADAITLIPKRFRREMKNIAIIVEDEPSADLLEEMEIDPPDSLYGLYQGTPLPGRAYDFVGLPDRVSIFAGPLMRDYRTAHELGRQIRQTVMHEIAHFFGFEERRIRGLGF